MKNLFLITLLLALSLTSFSQEGKWKKATKKNTIESYQKFLERYPSSEYSADAKSKIIELEYDIVKETNTLDSYENFIKKYPSATLTSDAKNKLMKIEYNKAQSENSIQSYEHFLQRYSEGEFVSKAENNLMNLEYKNAKSENSIQSFEAFIRKYPNESLTEEAKKNLMNLEYKEAELENTIQSYENFITIYPECDLTNKAKEKLESLEYEKAESENSIRAFELFMKKYPDIKYKTSIDKKIINIKLGCDFIDKPLSSEAENELSNTQELIGQGDDVELLSSLYSCIVKYTEIKENARPQIHKILISVIDSENNDQFTESNENVNKLLDLYTFKDSYSTEYSYEAALCRELQVKIIRPFLKKTLNKLEQQSLNAGMAMFNGDPNGQQVMMQCIILQREMAPIAMAIDSRTANDLIELKMTKCAKYHYLTIIDKILTGVYEQTHEWNLGSKGAYNYEEKLKEKENEQKMHKNELVKKLKKSLYKESNKLIIDYTNDIIQRHENK